MKIPVKYFKLNKKKMTINNLDKILRNLDDFDPQAKPNWDAFVAENESGLPSPKKAPARPSDWSIATSQSVKFTGILVLTLAVFFSTWYFTTDKPGAENQQTPEKHQATQSQDNTIESVNTRQDILLNEQLVPLPEHSNQLIEDNTIYTISPLEATGIETDPLGSIQVLLDEAIEPTMELGQSSGLSRDESPTETLVRISDTVVVKKTIIVKDTIRVTKHLKK